MSKSSRSQLFCMRLFWKISQISHQIIYVGLCFVLKLQALDQMNSDSNKEWNCSEQVFYRALESDFSWTSPGNSNLVEKCSFNFSSANMKFLVNWTNVIIDNRIMSFIRLCFYYLFFQKQLFTSVLENSYVKNLCKSRRKALVLEFSFSKALGCDLSN